MTNRDAAPILLALLQQGPKSHREIRAAIPARNPVFIPMLLQTAITRGEVRLDNRTLLYSLA